VFDTMYIAYEFLHIRVMFWLLGAYAIIIIFLNVFLIHFEMSKNLNKKFKCTYSHARCAKRLSMKN
jgi:hypothetical protein